MIQLQSLLDWLTALPSGTLLFTMGLLAAVENIFPPIPADVLVAFGGFLAARADGSPWPSFLVVWLGNVAGAGVMYWLGRRMGSGWIRKRFHLSANSPAETRLLAWHARYGIPAFFVSRFVPGVRSIVPPIAGALRIPPVGVFAAVALASAIWYGLITWLAFRAGSNWDVLAATIGRLGWWTGLIAAALVAVVVAIWWLRRRRRR